MLALRSQGAMALPCRCSAPAVLAAMLLALPRATQGSMQPPLVHLRRGHPPTSLSLEQTDGDKLLRYGVTVLRRLPHVNAPFTQGLEFAANGHLVETSGSYPAGVSSFLRTIDPKTGQELQRITAGMQTAQGHVFVEGISLLGDRWLASTYNDNMVLEFNRDLNFVQSHAFPYEGWGLSRSPDGHSLLATNGTANLMTLDTHTFEALEVRSATCLGRLVPGLNELELVDNFQGRGPTLLGNIINTRLVLALNPKTAQCTGVFSLDVPNMEAYENDESYGYHVANGIAYNRANNTFYVTGKNWLGLYEIRIEEEHSPSARQSTALETLQAYLASSAWNQ